MADNPHPKHSRWTDDPFWQPQTPEEKEWISKRDAGLQPYREARTAIGFVEDNPRNGYKVDDPEWRPQTREERRWYEIYRKAVSHLVEIGLFPKDSVDKLIGVEDKKSQKSQLGGMVMTKVRKTYSYRGGEFRVSRRSPHKATVNLACGEHRHKQFIVGLIEETGGDWASSGSEDSDWAVGNKDRGYPFEGNFSGAVDHAADILLEECRSMGDIQDFFGDEAKMRTTEKVQIYGGKRYTITSTSPVSAKMNIHCVVHDHHDYIIGLVEHEAAGWVVGRPGLGAPKYSAHVKFAEVVEYAGNLLLRECVSMEQVDDFFKEEAELVDETEEEVDDEVEKSLSDLLRELEGEFDKIDRERDEK